MPSEVFADGLLSGRVVLVTGGGSGLGKAAAGELARCGATVVIAGRRADVLDAAAREMGADWVAGDIRNDAERLVGTCLDRHGRLDVLVNNAGGRYFVPAEAIERKGWRAVTGLNVGGTERMTRCAYALAMRPAGSGTIVNITLPPHHGLTGMAHSSAARAAVEGRGLHARARAGVGGRRRRGDGPGRRPLRHGIDPQVPGAGLARRGPHGAAGPPPASRSTPGWSPCARRRLARRCPAPSSRSTAPATTGSAPGPRRRWSRRRARSRWRPAARGGDAAPMIVRAARAWCNGST